MTTMVKKRVAELEVAQLDWAVAVALGHRPRIRRFLDSEEARCAIVDWNKPGTLVNGSRFEPSNDWSQGGPIIEREGIELWPDSINDSKDCVPGVWFSRAWNGPEVDGHAPLIAAMRAFVASKLGDEVEVPAT